jgi:hypothetical protein
MYLPPRKRGKELAGNASTNKLSHENLSIDGFSSRSAHFNT